MSRHAEWHELLEALGAEGCAVCFLVERSSRRYLASLLHESVNDPGIRQRLRRAGGFCSRHVAMLLEKPDALGLAILAEDVVGEVSADLEKHLTEQAAHSMRAPCPACAQVERVEADFLSSLAQGLSAPELRERYAAGQGLCLPHLAQVAAQAGPPERYWLEQTEARLLAALREQLREVVRKNDYRYRDEPWGEERDAWRRALWKLAGRHVVGKGPGGKG